MYHWTILKQNHMPNLRYSLTFISVSMLIYFCYILFPNKKAVFVKNGFLTLKTCNFENPSKINTVIDTFFYIVLHDKTGSFKALGDLNDVKIYNDTLWVLDSKFNLFAFQKNGQIIGQVNKNGDGPGRTLQISDFEVLNGEVYTLEMSKSFLQVYDGKTFEYIKNINLSPEFTYSNLAYWNAQWFFFAPSALSDHALHVYSEDFKLKYKLLSHTVNNKSMLLVPPKPLILNNKKMTVNLMFNDTLFEFNENNRILPKLLVDLCGNKLTNDDKKRIERTSAKELMNNLQHYLRIINLQENTNFYWLSTLGENMKYNEILFDKKTGRYKNLENVEHVKNQPLSINFITNYQGYFISKLNEDQITEIDLSVKPLGVLQFIKFKSP